MRQLVPLLLVVGMIGCSNEQLLAAEPATTKTATSTDDPPTGQDVLTLQGHINRVWSVAFSPDGKRLASASGSFEKPGEVKMWDAATGKEVRTLARITIFLYLMAYHEWRLFFRL